MAEGIVLPFEVDATKALSGLSDISVGLKQLNNTAEEVQDQTKKLGSSGGVTAFATAWTAGLQTVQVGFGLLKGAVSETFRFLKEGVNTVIELGGRWTDLAAKMGISTDEIQQINYAVAAVGMSAEAVSGIMLRLQRTSESGSKGTAAAFKQLGLSMNEVKNQAPAQMLTTVVEALGKMEDASKRNALAMQLLGRQGPLLAALGGEFRGLQNEAMRLGVVMKKDVIASADDLGDSIDWLKLTWSGLKNNMMGVLVTSELVHVGMRVLREAIGDLSKYIQDHQKQIQDWIGQGLVALVKAFGWVAQSAVGLVNTYSDMRIGLIGLEDMTKKANVTFVAFMETLSNPLKAKANYDQLQADLKRISDETANSIAKEELGQMKRNDMAGRVKAAIGGYVKELEKAAGASHAAGGGAESHAQKLANEAAAAKEADESMKRMNALFAEFRGDSAKQSVQDITLALGNLPTATEYSRGALEKWRVTLKQAADQDIPFAAEALALLDEKLLMLGPDMQKAYQEGVKFEGQLRKTAAAADVLKIEGPAGPGISKEIQSAGQQMSNLWVQAGKYRDVAKDTSKTYEERQLAVKSLEGALRAAGLSETEITSQVRLASMGMENMTVQTVSWNQVLQNAANTMTALGGKAGGVASIFAGMASAMSAGVGTPGGGIGGLKIGQKGAMANWQNMKPGQKAQAGAAMAMDAINSTIEAYNLGSTKGGKGVAEATGKGAMVGFQMGGPIGAAIGAGINFTSSMLGNASTKKAIKNVSAALGGDVTREMAIAIKKEGKDLGVSTATASLLHITEAASQSGKSIGDYSKGISALFKEVASGGKIAKEGVVELGKAFTMAQQTSKKAALDMVLQARETGVKIPEITAAVWEGLSKAGTGLQKIMEGMAGGFALPAEAAASMFSATFWGMVKEQGLVAAADALMPAFEQMQALLGETMPASFAQVQSLMNLAAGEATRPVLEAISGMQQVLTGLGEAGYMTVEAFQGVSVGAKAAFEQLLAGGATSKEAFLAIAPLLAEIQNQASLYGYNLDASTQSLISQAKEAGVAFAVDPVQAMAEGVKLLVSNIQELVKVMGGIPVAANAAAGAVGNLATAGKGVGVPPIGAPTGSEPPGFARGGLVIPRAQAGIVVAPRTGGTPVVMGEAGGAEVAAPVKALFGSLGDDMAARIAGRLGGMLVSVSVNVDGRELAKVIEKAQLSGALRILPTAVRSFG
jgi:predicted peroxiredoxin